MENIQRKKPFYKSRTFAFVAAFIVVFLVTLGALTSVGVIPVPRPQDITDTVDPATPSDEANRTIPQVAEYPVKIAAADIGLNKIVYSPNSTDEKTLDAALLKGAVHYPGSALLGEEGNVLLFGHSSYIPGTLNLAYKTFNGIQNLKTGQIITVSSQTSAYDYRVTSVSFAKATDDNVIDLSKSGHRLTLVTCNSFKTKSDRFVIEAEFVGKRAL